MTVDQRYDKSSYDGPFCLTAPTNPNLPGGGGYEVCGLYDLKPALVNLPQRSLLTFSDNYGGETNLYQGYDLSLVARFKQGAFVQAGISATRRVQDQCALVDAGIKAVVLDGTAANIGTGAANANTEVTEIFPDGSRACHQVYPYRPDAKILGSYTLPFDIRLSGTFQFTRGVQTGGAGPSILATYTAPAAQVTQALGRPLSAGRPSGAIISLIQPGTVYGDHNLSQLDLRLSKGFRIGAVPLPRRLRRLQHLQQQLAVHGHQHVLDAGDQPVAAADQRAAGAVLQAGGELRLLTRRRLNAEPAEHAESHLSLVTSAGSPFAQLRSDGGGRRSIVWPEPKRACPERAKRVEGPALSERSESKGKLARPCILW